MKIVIAQFKQETNVFSPVQCDMEMFRATYVYEGENGVAILKDTSSEIAGFLKVLSEEKVDVIPSAMMRAQSGSPVDRTVCDWFIERLVKTIKDNGPVDGVFLSLHGATQLADDDDGSGLILEAARKAAGQDAVISTSLDYHANITKKMVRNANIICGFHTYPHTDFFETGIRAARLGMKYIKEKKKGYMAFVKLPMLHPAEACVTAEEPLKGLDEYAAQLEKRGEIMDYSIYQMQPWMDVSEGGASVVVIADNKERADKYACDIAQRYFDMREKLVFNLYSLDDVIDKAITNTTNQPVVLVDSADSPSAGASGDSTAVLSRLLERDVDIKAALVVTDPQVPLDAQKVGVGNTGDFVLGGKIDCARHKPVRFKHM